MKRRAFVRQAAAAAAGLAAGGSLHRTGPLTAGRRTDLVLRRALVCDGTGAPIFPADVAIAGGVITAVGEGLPLRGATEVDLDGLVLAPGFIDIHSHTDLVLLRDPRAESKVRQGVTTEVTGQDGGSIGWSPREAADARERHRRDGIDIDFDDVGGFLRWIDRNGAAVNMASMVGAGTVRALVVGFDDRPATPEETAHMTALVRTALAAGACGLSSGLEYTPGAFADAAELQALAAPLRGTGLPFASHMRNEDDRLLAAIEEVIGVGQRAAVAVHISHLKAQGERNWWKAAPAIRLIEDARTAGIDATFDVYPYVAYATALSNLFPVWAREGGTDTFLARLASSETAARIEQAVHDKISMLGSWDAVQMSSGGGSEYAWVAGRRLGDAARQRGVEPYALLVDIMRGDRARTRMVGFGMSEENVALALQHPLSMVCSDGGAVTRTDGTPHPRNYGTFPRVLGRYCRELKVLSVEAAVRKMTSLPADRLRLHDRGRIAEGLAADLVAFDPAAVADRATFEEPHQFPVGIPHVLVNGTFVIRNGVHTGARPGRAARPAPLP